MRLADRLRAAATLASAVARRFPVSVLLAAIGTGCALWGVASRPHSEGDLYWRIMFSCVFGLPLSVALSLTAETTRRPRLRLLPGVALVSAGGLAAWLLSLPDRMPETEAIRLLTLIIASHLSVAVLPYLQRPGDDRYWAFQVRLFLRFLLGGLYAAVLFGGTALALLSVDRLLDLDISDHRYGQLWFLMSGFVHPLFTLGGIGRVDDNHAFQPMVGLRKFVQFVFVPLTALYLGILYLYAGKIAGAWELPNGWVGLPVLILSVVGILGALLLHPWSADATTPWVRRFTRGFFALTTPLTGLLALSIGVRVTDYGVTEPRYYVVLLTAWLFGVCLIRTWKPHRDLRLIPASLLALALLGSLGPWSASAWSLRSQTGRVEASINRLQLRDADGALRAFDATLADDAAMADATSLADTLRYLRSAHGQDALARWVEDARGSTTDLITHLALDRLQHEQGHNQLYNVDSPLHVTTDVPAQTYFVWLSDAEHSPTTQVGTWSIRFSESALTLTGPAGDQASLEAIHFAALSASSDSRVPLTRLSVELTTTQGRTIRLVFQNLLLSRRNIGQPRFVQTNLLLALPID